MGQEFSTNLQGQLRQGAQQIETLNDFKQWVRDDVRRILPHSALACGHGRMHSAGVATDYIVTVDFPVEHLAALCNPAGGIDTPLMRRWMLYREPQLFDAASPSAWPEISPAWLEQFRQHGLANAAVHAKFDTERYLGSYFSFHQLPAPPGTNEYDILIAITPILHEALTLAIAHTEKLEREQRPAWDKLTQREIEMLEWVGRGLNNAEIAARMQLSENTVKHHVSNIFEKTNLTGRSNLMAALAKYPPGIISKGTKVL